MAEARALFRGSNFPRHAGVIERVHVNQKAPRQRDVAGDARAFLAERLFRDLNDDFLSGFQQIGNKLGPLGLAAVMAAMSATERLAPTAAVTIPTAAPHGPLHPGTKIAADASLHRLWLRGASFRRHCIVRRFFAVA